MGVGGSQYDVVVKLSTLGNDQLSANLKNVQGVAQTMAAALNSADAGTKRLSASFRQTDADGNKFSVTMRDLGQAHGKYVSVADQLTASLFKMATAFEAVRIVRDVVGDLFSATKAHEDMVTTMAATMTATNGWSNSVAIATDRLGALKETAALVNSTEDQMVSTFTMLKRTFGGTSDEAVTLTGKLALLARQSGASIDELATRLAAASITGKLEMRGPAGIALTGAGIDPQVLMTMKEAGLAMEYLNATIADNPGLVERLKDGWSYLTAEFKKNKEEALETIGQGLEPLKKSLKELNATLSSDESQQDFDKLGQNLAVLTDQLKGLFAPGGMQESEHWYTDFLDKTIAFFSTLILIWKTGLDSVGNVAAAGWDVITHPLKYLGPDGGDAMKAELSRILDEQLDIFKRGAAKVKEIWKTAMAEPDSSGDTGPTHHELAETPTKPAPGRPSTARADAFQKFQDEVNKFLASVNTSGLTGLDLALAKDEEQWTKNAVSIADWVDKWEKADPTIKGIAEKLRAALLSIDDEQRALAESKHLEEWARKYDDAMARIQSVVKDTALGKIDDTFIANAQRITDSYNKMIEAVHAPTQGPNPLDPPSVQAWMDYYDKIGLAGKAKADADARNLENWRLNTEKVLGEQTGDYQRYFNALVALDMAAGMSRFQAEQDAAKKGAAMLEAQADTAAKGFAAGLAAILASTRSFGQDVATLMTGLWSSMTSAFDTGFYDILSGKFNDLGNVLKSLWDSVLKDFSKMLSQMLERWLLTGEAMGSGQGTGGVFSKLLGGQGSTAVYTPGGTANQGEGWAPVGYGAGAGMGAYQTSGNASWLSGGGAGGAGAGGGLGTIGTVGALAGYGYGLYQGLGSIFTPHETSTPTYQGQSLGQTADFGGPGGGAALGAAATVALVAATATLATAAATGVAIAAAASATVPVIGWIAAAVLLIVAAIMTIFSGPKEGHVNIAIADAFDKAGAKTAIGGFVNQIFDSTTNYVGQLAFKAAGPDGVAGYVASYRKELANALGSAKFDLAAGSKDDLQKDVQAFFDQILPKLSLQAAFGQVGVGMPLGDRDWAGGAAGLDWNTNNGQMDAQGNFIKKQLYDPNAPIPLMLTGLGFTADRIGEIATKLSTATDMKVFEKWLSDLIGVVVDLGTLATKFGQTRDEWFASIRGDASKQGTAGQFSDEAANLKAGGELLATIFGDDRVAAGQQLVKDGQTLLANEQAALTSIVNFIDQIATQTASTIQAYQSKLLTSSENEAALRARATTDFGAIATAANPKDVAAAWQKVLGDMTSLLDLIVARIQAIKALQQSYADFRTQMATNAGPQFATDPNAWLAQNQQKISAVAATLATATGDDAIAGARTLLGLVQDRYNNELAMLQRVDSTVKAIDGSIGSALQNLQLQGMGSVVNGVWTPDVHAQGDFMMKQIGDLQGQLAGAQTPEEVQRITSQIEQLVSQLASQPQDPSHYAESRAVLEQILKDTQAAADKQLKTMHDALTLDLKGIGDQLKLGETALATALGAAQKDFTTQLGLLQGASDAATTALNGFADGLVTQMGELTKAIKEWIAFFTNTDPTGTKAPGTPGTKPGGLPPTPRHGPEAAPVLAPPPIYVSVKSGAPEDVAAAAAAAVYPAVLAAQKASNLELVRALRNNPALLSRTS